MFYRNIIFLCLLQLLATFAVAKEHEATAPAKGAAAAAEEAAYSGKQNQDWEKVQTQLGAAKAKLVAQEALVQKLAEEKAALHGEAQVAKIEELKTEDAKLATMTTAYNKLNEDYLTKYPEKGRKEPRVYKRVEQKPLHAYDNNQSLQGRVKHLQKKILQQYSAAPAAKSPPSAKTPPTKEVPADKLPAGTDVTDPILYKK